MREIEQMEKKRQKLGEEHAAMFPSSRVSNGAIIDRTPDGSFGPRDGDVDSTTYSNKSPATHFMSAYYDADEGSVDGVLNGGGTARKGARCPVLGASLSKTGDQLYAPYLQRPYPLTDDVIAQRQIMMRRQKGAKASATIKQRIEIAQRLQRPKLLSDMQAFKAANPGAVFQDFVGW